MGLNSAHQGYAYQDLLTAYFILKDIIYENESTFRIDVKEYAGDKFDDLTIVNSNGIFKNQIKYSNEDTSHVLSKDDLSSNSYELALDELFASWNSHPQKLLCKVRLCLAWDSPSDELKNIFKISTEKKSFVEFDTNIFEIDIDLFWAVGKSPLKSWRRFNSVASKIDRTEFAEFLKRLTIELNLPKSSQDIYNAGELEQGVLFLIDKLGIGYFPNDNWKKEEFALSLLELVKKARSNSNSLNTANIFNHFKIRTDYGSIEQKFPVNYSQNIEPKKFCNYLLARLETDSKIILTGEPGGGKSWFVDNLKNYLNKKKIHVVKHLCYTDLDDSSQKERIKLNVFFGNLINQILEIFPDLKNKKERRYASNLSELNLLLSNITEKTILIVDGIDHIDRIFQFKNYQDLSKKDIDIINRISEIEISEYVKILIVSQPLADLKKIIGFKSETIPAWKVGEIQEYMIKNKVAEIEFDTTTTLSEFLLEKSSGNPLYLKYLVDEIQRQKEVKLEHLKTLPDYSENLTNYYGYILAKLNLREQLPRILSGVNFSLTRKELKEITGGGGDIDEALEIIAPVIKTNISQSGYVIYHESFRRFIVEKLKTEGVSIDQNIFTPIIHWFEKMGIYEYVKSYRFYFQYTYELGRTDGIIPFIAKDFITKSVYYGHSWSSIENNYKYLLKTALRNKDFPKIILLNELNKVLSTVQDSFDDNFTLYLDALGHLRGFKYVSDYLSFDGAPTLDLKQGLEACYLCNTNRTVAPWELYFDYFQKGKNIELDEFKFYVTYLLIYKDKKELLRVCKAITKRKLNDYCKVFRSELIKLEDKEFIEILKNESKSIADLLLPTPTKGDVDFEMLANEILRFKHWSGNESKVTYFLNSIDDKTLTQEVYEKIRKKFAGINWVHNWLIYAIKIKLLKSKEYIIYREVKDTFSILIYDTEPFKGEPRTCDLYSYKSIIYESISEGLSLLKPEDDWKPVLDILQKLSDETTTSFQKGIGGPLPTDRLFKILDEHQNCNNRSYIISIFQTELKDKESDHLHSYLSEYCFRLSKMYSIIGEGDLANQTFTKGVEYSLGYTFRKDLTLEDLIESIAELNSFDGKLGNEYVKKIKPLVDAVVNHTDGKHTKHFPVEWFEKFIEINFESSGLYLLHELIQTRIDWRLEESLQDLLEKSNGTVNPIVELLICRTLPIESSEAFLNYSVDVALKVSSLDFELAQKFLISTYQKSSHQKNQGYSVNFKEKLNSAISKFNLTSELNIKKIAAREEYPKHSDPIRELKNNCIVRKEFSEMTNKELADFISTNEITDKELNSLVYLFESTSQSTVDYKELVKSFFSSTHRYRQDKLDASVLFNSSDDSTIYYWISRYVNDMDGWFKSFVNIEALEKAYRINKAKAIEFLCELLFEKLHLQYSRTLSANLLNGLIKINFDNNAIRESWLNLFNTIDYRLPAKEEYNWDEALSNEIGLNTEEVFICLLFSRFKSYTTERNNWTLSGISYMLFNHPDKMIKPLKWFLKKHDYFLESVLLSVTTLIYEFEKEYTGYANNFKAEFEELYPQNYFLIDATIELIYSKPKRTITLTENNFYYPIDKSKAEFLVKQNLRSKKLLLADLDIENVLAKAAATFTKEYPYERYLDLYGNTLYKIMVHNIYLPNYILKLINTDLYQSLYKFKNFQSVVEDLKLDVKSIVAQVSSTSGRPLDLILPSKLDKVFSKNPQITVDNNWVRIGYCERELVEENHYTLSENYAYGVIDFSTANEYPLSPSTIDIWNVPNNEYDECVVHFFRQYDSLENYKLLWLNPALLEQLEITPIQFQKGLAAENLTGEIVLKYNCWSCSYIGNGDIGGIDHEIPQLDGAELIIRNDYFQRICEIYGRSPAYSLLRVTDKD